MISTLLNLTRTSIYDDLELHETAIKTENNDINNDVIIKILHKSIVFYSYKL